MRSSVPVRRMKKEDSPERGILFLCPCPSLHFRIILFLSNVAMPLAVSRALKEWLFLYSFCALSLPWQAEMYKEMGMSFGTERTVVAAS